jgi:type IV pilus assembly protein PilN
MAHINLLPWREELRAKRQRDFLTLLGASAVFMALAMLYVHFFVNGLIDDQTARNNYLRQEIARVDKLIEEIDALEETKEKLLARMEIIQRLQTSRPEIVHLFDELVETIPEGVFLTKLEQQGAALRLTGRAESNARVSAYMRNIDTSPWIGDPDLKLIENKEKTETGLSHFELRAKQLSKVSGE